MYLDVKKLVGRRALLVILMFFGMTNVVQSATAACTVFLGDSVKSEQLLQLAVSVLVEEPQILDPRLEYWKVLKAKSNYLDRLEIALESALKPYEVADRKNIERPENEIKCDGKTWSQRYFYRGMSLNSDDISYIIANGMLTSKIGPIFPGIFAAKDVNDAIPHTLRRLGPKRKLGVLFEIDPEGLATADAWGSKIFKNNIPPESIRRILIFNPNAALFNCPFVELLIDNKN